jgi:hypothetical protein
MYLWDNRGVYQHPGIPGLARVPPGLTYGLNRVLMFLLPWERRFSYRRIRRLCRKLPPGNDLALTA